MAVNKVAMNTENGVETLIDLTEDTVTPETLAEGTTAHDASGNVIVGTLSVETIPDYWKNPLDEGIEAINTALCTAGSNKSAFLFYSDVHWNFGSQMSPKLLKHLYKHTGMTKTFFGGDIVNNEGNDYDTMEYLWDWRNQIKTLPNHHSVVGNHDDGNSTNNLFSEKYVYGYLFAAEETPDIVRGKGLYYYIDNPVEKTRYLFLDTAYKGAVSYQQEFVKEALIDTPEGWHIVAVSHIWYDTIYTTTPPSVGGLNSSASIFLSMFDNYNNRGGDYADCKGWVEFCIGGHTHRDYDGTSESGIPIILVETDSRDVRNGKTEAQYKYTAGTATESSINGIIADYDNHKIYVVRIGRGESRDITVTNYEISYTNQIPLSTDASGAIYDGKGYKDGIRLGSDGSDRTGAATDATGFIPCTISDTLYFKNCQIAVLGGTATTYQNIGCYDSTKQWIATRFVDMASHMSGKDYSVDSNNYLTRYNCADLWTNTAFVRITGDYIGVDSIITKNEPIE